MRMLTRLLVSLAAFASVPLLADSLGSSQFLVQLVSLKLDAPVAKFANIEQVQILSPGTTFRIKTPGGIFWVTASHVVSEVQKAGGEFYLLSPESSSIKYSKVKDLFQIMDSGVLKIESSSILQDAQLRYDGESGDFSYFKDTKGQESGLSVRDLAEHPLVLGEKIQIAGRLWGHGEKRVDCKHVGMRADHVARGSLQMLLDCNESFLGSDGKVKLGTVSGAATLDAKGHVVGVFNGFAGYQDRTGKQLFLLRSTPIFIGPTGSPQLRPNIHPAQPLTFSCVVFPENGLLRDFIENPASAQKPCRLPSPASVEKAEPIEALQ